MTQPPIQFHTTVSFKAISRGGNAYSITKAFLRAFPFQSMSLYRIDIEVESIYILENTLVLLHAGKGWIWFMLVLLHSGKGWIGFMLSEASEMCFKKKKFVRVIDIDKDLIQAADIILCGQSTLSSYLCIIFNCTGIFFYKKKEFNMKNGCSWERFAKNNKTTLDLDNMISIPVWFTDCHSDVWWNSVTSTARVFSEALLS